MKELVHNEHVFVAKAKKEELHTVLRRLYENGTVFIYREDESLLLMIPSKEIVEVELDSRRVWSGILICGDVFRLVIIDEEDKELQDGRIYLIAEQNNGLRIRRLRKVDGVWWLFPDNPEYPPERLTPDLWIVGRVLYKIKPAIVEVAK